MQWGNWIFNRKNLTLTHKIRGYEIDLEKIQTSAEILDWIFQVLGKQWADANTMHDLLRAFDEILSPQTNYCPMGKDRLADGGELARKFAAGLKQ